MWCMQSFTTAQKESDYPPGNHHLLTTGTDVIITLAGTLVIIKVSGHQHQWLWPGNRKFLNVTSMVVSWWIVCLFLCAVYLHRDDVFNWLSQRLMYWDTFNQDNYSTVGGDGGCRVDEVQARTTSPVANHIIRVLSYSNCQRPTHSISNFKKSRVSTSNLTGGFTSNREQLSWSNTLILRRSLDLLFFHWVYIVYISK